jgi:uncharacterized protein
MRLEGTVTNVAAFGAFVDIGVHQDGLVHLSQLADRFVKDAHEVVKAGDVVQVRVLDVDAARKRIALTMRTSDAGATGRDPKPDKMPPRGGPAARPAGGDRAPASAPGALGAKLAEALKRR